MLHRTTPQGGEQLLSDGTPLSSLIDRDKREVSVRVMNDPDIHELELERLWSKAWILIGHDSEIPKIGDYVTRQVGDDMVVAVRQRDGTVGVLLNACPHRAMQVCRTGAGNATVFKCIYHGWTFGLDGGFRGAPFDDEAYPNGLDPESRKMLKARVELFGGLIFVNWSDDAPSLDEFLGDIGWYLKMNYDRTAAGFEVFGAPQRYIINANWKLAAEQASGDGYHGVTLHRSLIDLGVFGERAADSRAWGQIAHKVSVNGHGFKFHDLRDQYGGMVASGGAELSTMERLKKTPPAGMPPELVEEYASRFNDDELRAFADLRPGVGNLFPNVHVIAFYAPDPAGGVAGMLGVHTFVPKGPDQFEFMHWNFVERGASEEFRKKMLRTATFNAGASGVIEQDDSEVWPGIQKTARGFIGRKLNMRYPSSIEPATPEGWFGGGKIYSGFNTDDSQWNWWNRYFDYLTGAEG